MRRSEDLGGKSFWNVSMKRRLLVLFFAPSLFFACGGKTANDQPEADVPGPWGPGMSVATVDPLLGDILDVPAGAARIGEWTFDRASNRYEPEPCDPVQGRSLGSMTVRTVAFRMMRLEVSGEQYATCVHSGRCTAEPDADLSWDPTGARTWDDPRRAKKPAAVTYRLAREFCSVFGGDLPTYPEWIRAAEGDDGQFGIPKLSEQFYRCAVDASAPICVELVAAAGQNPPLTPGPERRHPLADVGSTVWDVGPYGHADLFGGASEWVRHGVEKSQVSCASDGMPEGAIFGPPWDDPDGLSWTMQLAMEMFYAAPGIPIGVTRPASDLLWESTFHGQVKRPEEANIYSGFRCAFPASQK
jgi:hypothetical protein